MRAENPHITIEGTDNDVVDAAEEFLRVHGHERWFLYVHLMDLHQYLYNPDTALFGTAYSDIYDNSIRHEDDVVGRLLTFLAETGQLQKTLIVIVSDHGEAFGERGYEGHARHVYRETTRVPLIIGMPFLLDEVVVDTLTRNVDVWPTILDLLGLPPLPDTDGRSFKPELLAASRGEPHQRETVGFAHLERGWGRTETPTVPAVAVVEGDYRFVLERRADDDVEELFDASTDPREVRNVIDANPEVAARMRDRANAYLQSKPPPWGTTAPRIELDQMELNQLRALGYDVE